ncbi:MAG: DoxX family membrane protein [Rubrobacteraceae bacterium]
MTWVRILVGAVWLNGAAEKILNPQFPQQFAQSIKAGGYVSQAPQWFQAFMKTNVVPNAELYANLTRAGELALGIALLLGLLTNLAALGSIAFSLMMLVSLGGFGFGVGLGPPEFLNINLIIALLSLLVLISARAKDLSLDAAISQDRPLISPLLTNRRAGGGNGQDKV